MVHFLSRTTALDLITLALFAMGVGLLLLLSRGSRFRMFRRVFGPSRTRMTLEGKLFLAMTGVMCMAAINTHINLMYLVAGLMLSAIFISATFSRIVQKIDVARSVPAMVAAGEPVSVRLTLTNARKRITVFTVVACDNATGPAAAKLPAVTALQLRPGVPQAVSYRCVFPRRGVYGFTHVLLKSRFPFGLFEMQFERPLPAEIVVHPAIGRIRSLPNGHAALAGQIERPRNTLGQDEFSHLRDYRPDDNPRRIHWRTSARLRKLHVMEFQGLPARAAEIEFDAGVPDASGEPGFERAARFAATLADHLSSQDYSLRFILDDRGQIAGHGRRVLPEILEGLARVQPQIRPRPLALSPNGTSGLKVRILSTGKCSFSDHVFVAAGADPELDAWYWDNDPRLANVQPNTDHVGAHGVCPRGGRRPPLHDPRAEQVPPGAAGGGA